MKIVIIEDEPHTASDLANTIIKVEPDAEIIAVLSSGKEALAWFDENDGPDLIFSDIQLGDGLSFKIFDTLRNDTPVIFCTAYDKYALQAFKAAGIGYILKPFTQKTVAEALLKFKQLKNRFTKAVDSYAGFEDKLVAIKKQAAILVFYKDKILPVKLEDIALFYLHNNITHLVTFAKEQYYINETLEEVESIAGNNFYRVNRQYLVQKRAIKDVSKYFGRKLLLNLNTSFTEKITVSKIKANHFLAWLAG